MDVKKTIKTLLLLICVYFFFPSFTGGIFIFGLKFFLYCFLLFICSAVIHDSVNYIVRNWHKIHLLWIDEREHIVGNGISNLRRLNFLGATFRLIHYINFNKKRLIKELWFICLENLPIALTLLGFFVIFIGFIIYGVFFIS